MIEGAIPGKGKYGDACEDLVKKLEAKGIVLIVLDGQRGNGMSVSAPYWEFGGMMELMQQLPELLHGIANSIAAQQKSIT